MILALAEKIAAQKEKRSTKFCGRELLPHFCHLGSLYLPEESILESRVYDNLCSTHRGLSALKVPKFFAELFSRNLGKRDSYTTTHFYTIFDFSLFFFSAFFLIIFFSSFIGFCRIFFLCSTRRTLIEYKWDTKADSTKPYFIKFSKQWSWLSICNCILSIHLSNAFLYSSLFKACLNSFIASCNGWVLLWSLKFHLIKSNN